ncbi:peptide deformylase [uncultured Cohaesibacter sp.]|uniref:peptide deformylase n=1 Tax=uncultured Cohaesibacter sp. TaxID=1002546 RepID=UPI00292D88BD|nr:peptide deformylase [uncultured Cohaesibacter sp.]
MAVMDIITLPDPILRKQSLPVERIDDDLRRLIDDMLETMYKAPGIGLAGIQVGVDRRLFVMDVSREENNPICMINPEIITRSEELNVHEEGCLSIPDYYAEVERPKIVTMKFLDRFGKEQQMELDEVGATCAQHEFDHLNGALFIDYLSKLRRDRVIKKFAKLAKQKEKNIL